MDKDFISRYFYEDAVTRLERTIEKLWILSVILVLLLVGTNGAWLYYESQFKEVVETTTVDQDVDTGNGDANITGIGDIVYGESETTGNEDN